MEHERVSTERLRRKALMMERGLTIRSVANAVPCSELTVSNVIAGRGVFETPKTKRVKALIAEGVGLRVTDLWPEPEGEAA